MTDKGSSKPHNDFEANKAGTVSRSLVEARIDRLRTKGGVFVEAVRSTRTPMALADPTLPGNPIVFVNDAFLRISGYTMDEVLGQQPDFMSGSQVAKTDAARFREALEQDRDEVIESVQFRKDGSRFVASVFISAFKGKEGQTLYQFLSYQDITRRVAAEEELSARNEVDARLSALSTASSEVHYRMSPDWSEMREMQSGGFLSGVVDPTRAWLMDYIPDQDRASVTAAIEDAIKGKHLFELEHRVVRADGSVGWTFSRAVPILGPDSEIREWFGAAIDITRRREAEQKLRESEERFRVILDSVLDYAIFTTDATGRIQTWPRGAEAVFGWTSEEAIGRDSAMTFTPEDRQTGVPQDEMAEAARNGFAPNVRWHIRKGGERVFIEGSTRPLRDGDPGVHGYLKVGQDVTARRQWEKRQDVLLAELQHRTRNLLGVVAAMFDRTRRDSATTQELTATYKRRVSALARVQSMLSRLGDGARVPFEELLRSELSAVGALDIHGFGEHVVLDGPSGVLLRSTTLQIFALALHELATNASKYGALAQPNGHLSVRWRLLQAVDGQRLHIEWVESGIVIPDPNGVAKGSGYGRELIERALPFQLGADTSYKINTEGVRCTIELPVSKRTASEDPDDD